MYRASLILLLLLASVLPAFAGYGVGNVDTTAFYYDGAILHQSTKWYCDGATWTEIEVASSDTIEITETFANDDDWTATSGTWVIGTGEYDRTANGVSISMQSATALSAIIQWAKLTIVEHPYGATEGLLLRGANSAGTGAQYTIVADATTSNLSWRRITGTANGETMGTQTLAFEPGDVLAAAITGVGDDTVVHVWKNPTGATPSEWGLGTAALTFTDNPVTAVDAGNYAGIYSYTASGVPSTFDDFMAGTW